MRMNHGATSPTTQPRASTGLANVLNLDSSVLTGIERLLFDYADVRPEDTIIIVYTPEVRESVALVCLVLNAYGFRYSLIPMRPLSDRGFRDRLLQKVPPDRIEPGKTVALVFEWGTMSHNQIFRDLFGGYRPNQRQIVRCINTGRDLFAIGLQPLPEELSRRNANLLHFLSK